MSSIEDTIDQAILDYGGVSNDAMRWTPDSTKALADRQAARPANDGLAHLRQVSQDIDIRRAAINRANQLVNQLRASHDQAAVDELMGLLDVIFPTPPPPPEPTGPRYGYVPSSCDPHMPAGRLLFLGGPWHGRRESFPGPPPHTWAVMPPMEPLTYAAVVDVVAPAPQPILYQLRHVGDFERTRDVYVADDYDGPAQW